VVGCEALLRWRHPELGLIAPGEFIAIAEKTDLIVSLGQWVLEQACQQLRRWSCMPGMAQLHISVNVSARQFRHPHFLEQALTLIAGSGIDAAPLKLEMTESMMVDSLPQTIATMRSLREAGVRLSLDDFGTGYASLSYLKQLPLDELKIDRAFVVDVDSARCEGAIAQAIVALGHSLDLSVVAEGVETTGQRDFLVAAGCDQLQGYLISRPLPIDAFERFCTV
jgi:EAL domain-containing protein (putative c-di-GMP-specific phosphodiesterase class I)